MLIRRIANFRIRRCCRTITACLRIARREVVQLSPLGTQESATSPVFEQLARGRSVNQFGINHKGKAFLLRLRCMICGMNPFARLTPGHVVRIAKVFAMGTAMIMTAAYVTDRLTVETAGIASFCLALSLLLAVPNQRSSELLGAAAIWMTTAEFMSCSQSAHFDMWRWAVAIATLALVILPLKVQYMRQLARTNPYATIADQDRRAWSAGAMPLAPSMVVIKRVEAPHPELEATAQNA